MPEEHEKIKYLPGEKPLKALFIIFADLECSLEKTQYCQNNSKNSYAEKKAKHKPSVYACCSICSFDNTKNKRYFHRERIVLKSFIKI